MLEKITQATLGEFVNFSAIAKDSHGAGKCFVYNAVAKHTKAGKPFVTLYLRDVRGNTVPGYIFDLKSPLLAGAEMNKVINSIVEIEWQENYLRNLGLTLILDKVSVVIAPTAEELAKFTGQIENNQGKRAEIERFLADVLKFRVNIPLTVSTYAGLDYAQGKVGGLCEHYWRMCKILGTFSYLSSEEFRNLVATYTLYIVVHQSYTVAKDTGGDSIDLVVALTSKVTSLAKSLKLSSGALELVNMFFGYTPKDIYVKTIVGIANMVQQTEKEFALYQTIPVQQEGNAGYGTIRRYFVEEG